MNTQRSVSIRHQRQDRGLGLREDALRSLDTRGTQRRHTGRAAALHGAAVGQHLTHGRRLSCKSSRPDREPRHPCD